MHAWVVLLALLAPPALAADEAADAPPEGEAPVGPTVERVTGLVPAELAELQVLRARLEERAEELEQDTLAWVERQRAVQVQRLADNFDPLIQELEGEASTQRSDAIAAMEGFLRRWEGVAYASDVRLRLAELTFQQAEEEWLAATTRYYAQVEAAGDDLDLLAELEEQGEPQIDLAEVIRLLTRIIEDNRAKAKGERFELLDVAYYMLGFCYEEPASRQRDRDQAREVFRDLVRVDPDSSYSADAHLLLGAYAFEENDFAGSIPEFEAVVARGPSEKQYGLGLYQLAWAHYKLSEYDEAMRLFVELLDRSREELRATGRASDYEPDAITYLALSLADRADAEGRSPLQEAEVYFDSLGVERDYEWDVLVSLASSLVDYARPEDAVEIYQMLQSHPSYRLRPENPDFQNEIVQLLSRGYDADLAAAGQARLDMTERYGEGSEWWLANRSNPDALAKARGYIESSLLEVAVEVKVRAQESADPAAYSLAADKYREYLEKFPISDDWFANQFQLADALYNAERLDEAAREYEELVRNERFHQFGDASVYMLFRTRERLMRDRLGPPDQRAADAPVERVYTSVGGVELPVYGLLDVQKAFMESAARVLDRAFGPPVEGIDLSSIVEDNRPKIIYLQAQLSYYANRFDEARPKLQDLIERFSRTDEAAYAANLLLNSYIVEKDNANIRRWSRAFATMQLGASANLVAEKEQQFRDTLEKSTYLLGTEAYDRGDYLGAAEAYLSFAEEFPDSPNVPDALLSAAFNYDRLGRAADANALYERFIREFPDHPDAKPFYFQIASNYEAQFRLDEAIRYYEELVRRFPDYEDSANALYMVAFLNEGKGEHLTAARTYERYATDYPSVSDREAVHFRAGVQYEAVDAGRAIDFYRRYLKTYGTTDPDHALEAAQRVADLLGAQGREREAGRALDEVVALYDRVTEAGLQVGPRGRDFAAKAAFRDLQALYDETVATKWSRNAEKDADLIVKKVPADIAAFDTAVAAFVAKYLSFEYTTAAVYLQGRVREWFAENGLAVAPPDTLPPDVIDYYWELLEEQLFPELYKVEESAVAKYLEVVDLGRRQRRHSSWVDLAQDGLNRVEPDEYPAAKSPIVVEAVGSEVPTLPPIKPAPPAGGAE